MALAAQFRKGSSSAYGCEFAQPRSSRFDLSGLSSPRPLPNAAWLGKLTEEIIEPGLPSVDPHHRLRDHPGSRHLLDEPLADVNSGHSIVATVFIQCGRGYRTSGPEEMRPIGEGEFVRAIAEEGDRRGDKTKICAGIVSSADLRVPKVGARKRRSPRLAGAFATSATAPHDPASVGASSYVPTPGLMDDPNFRRGLKRLPARDFTFKTWLYHPQIKTLTEVAMRLDRRRACRLDKGLPRS